MDNQTKNFVYELTEKEISALRPLLESRGWTLSDAPYMVFRAKKEKTSVCVYTSGKLVVQGRDAQEFVEFLLEPEILRERMFEIKTAVPEESAPFSPHAGIDESGKGDFFGPLVIAAVYVPDEHAASELLGFGVKDSKQIKNGQSEIPLGDEEKEALEIAIERNKEIETI